MYFWLMICISLFAIGDLFGVITKARLSSVFVALFLFLFGFLFDVFPDDIINLAGLSEVGRFSTGFIVFHMGTMINLQQLKKEWRTVVMALVSMIVAVVMSIAVMPLIGRENSMVAFPIINGGIVATQIMTAAALEKGFALAASFGTIVFAVQKFVGTPFASAFGLREGNKILAEYRSDLAKGDLRPEFRNLDGNETDPSKMPFWKKYEKYYTNFVCIAISAIGAWVAYSLQTFVPTINYSIWALILGVITAQIGIVPENVLDRGKASGFISVVVFSSLIPSLASISFADLGMLAFNTAVIFTAVMLGIYLFIYVLPLWKILGRRDLAFGVSVIQLMGFPANYLVANEIANAVADNPEERQVVYNHIMPAYIISNFVSVTSLSIVVAGIAANLL